MSGLVGDTALWKELARSWESVATGFDEVVPERVSERTLSLSLECFTGQQSPYGAAWQPSERVFNIGKSRLRDGYGIGSSGLGLTLIESGALMLSLYSSAGLRTFSIHSDVPYANIHQWGGEIGGYLAGRGVWMPARSYLPDPAQGLPPSWSNAWEAVINAYLAETFGGTVAMNEDEVPAPNPGGPSAAPVAMPTAARAVPLSENLLAELGRHTTSIGLSHLPGAIESLAGQHGLASVHAALLELDRAGRIELRPESGRDPLTAHQRSLLPAGPQGTRLTWARIKG